MHLTARKWVYHVLEGEQNTHLAKWVNLGLMIFIALNVLAVIFESEAELHATYRDQFYRFEVFSVLVFTLEYLIRVWICVESPNRHYRHPVWGRLRYMLSPMALIDLLVILPFYLNFLIGIQDLRILRTLRLLRVLKLTRYSQSMDLLLQVLRQEAEHMLSALIMLFILVLLAATGIYLVEGHQQPDAFGSIPRALWWATVTLTTVGYGDVVPHTQYGKIFSGLITITGIAVAALPAAILASGIINELERRREFFKAELQKALEDGVLDFSELRHLEKIRAKTGISRSDARLLIEIERREARQQTRLICPVCDSKLIAIQTNSTSKETGAATKEHWHEPD